MPIKDFDKCTGMNFIPHQAKEPEHNWPCEYDRERLQLEVHVDYLGAL